MQHQSVAKESQWLTTRDVARMLQLTVDGVRWLARSGGLPFEQARSGIRFFRLGDVRRLMVKRGDERIADRSARLAALRPRMLRVGLEPQQLVLDFSARLRLVGSRGKGRKVA